MVTFAPPSVLATFTAWMDRVVPAGDRIVVRTSPDFDDQARELIAGLERAGWRGTTLLVDQRPQGRPPVRCPVRAGRSLGGLWSYWRARVVVHTHGVYGAQHGAKAKRYLNIWHGMPLKRLPEHSDVGDHQTDVTIATAPLHARHLAATWRLAPEQVAITGLPRNDVLARPAGPRPPGLAALAGDRPVVVWLPTFRRQAGAAEVDGQDAGSATQLEGADPEAVDAALGRLGAFGIVKPHPLAPVPDRSDHPNLAIWSDADLAAHDLTLYQLLAHADVLVTDHSSVWIDFLLTGRPMAFAASDLEEYRSSRGFYFEDVEALLPGPLVVDLPALEEELSRFLAGDDRWAERRRGALAEHHVHVDAKSADRVAELALDLLWSRR